MSDEIIDQLREEVARRTAVLPAPPSPERIRTEARRRRHAHVAVAAAVLLLAAGGTAATVVRQVDRGPSAPVAGSPGGPQQAARERATAIVSAVSVPPGAREVDSPPAPQLAQPPSTIGSPNVATATRYWTWEGTFGDARSYFATSRENGRASNLRGDTTARGAVTSAYFGYGELLISFVALSPTSTGIRADAQVLWVPDKPASERVPDGVRSVEVLSYQGQPDHVLARKVVTGDAAQHLADLANDLVRDNRGTHGCTADIGLRKRLTFDTAGGQVVLDGFFCGSVVMTVDGVQQPPLSQSEALTTAVDEILGPDAVDRQ